MSNQKSDSHAENVNQKSKSEDLNEDQKQKNEEETEYDLSLFQVLLSTFIKEPSAVFQSEGDSHIDKSGTPYAIYTEDGITYITRGASNRKKKKGKFKSIFTLPSNNSAKDDKSTIKKLTEFTESLKSFTEEVNDIKITKFSLTWGIRSENDSIPCLINCDGSKYEPTPSSKPFISINTQIVLFNALEISRVPIPGKCFINNRSCFISEKSIIRHKLLQPKINKFISQFEMIEDKYSLDKYIQNRLNTLCPTLLMTIVPVCVRCYSKYSEVNRKPNLQITRINDSRDKKSTSRSSKISSLSHRSSKKQSQTDASTNFISTAPVSNRSPRRTNIVKNMNASYLRYTHDPQSVTARAMYFNHYTRKSPSGLTYSQNYSDVSVYRAHRIYSCPPMQVFPKP